MYSNINHITSPKSLVNTLLPTTLFSPITQSHKQAKTLINTGFSAWGGEFCSLHLALFYSLFKSDKQPLKYHDVETLCYIYGGKIVARHCGKHSQSPKRIQKIAEQVCHDNIESLCLAQGNKKPIAHCVAYRLSPLSIAKYQKYHLWERKLSLVPLGISTSGNLHYHLCRFYTLYIALVKYPFF